DKANDHKAKHHSKKSAQRGADGDIRKVSLKLTKKNFVVKFKLKNATRSTKAGRPFARGPWFVDRTYEATMTTMTDWGMFWMRFGYTDPMDADGASPKAWLEGEGDFSMCGKSAWNKKKRTVTLTYPRSCIKGLFSTGEVYSV